MVVLKWGAISPYTEHAQYSLTEQSKTWLLVGWACAKIGKLLAEHVQKLVTCGLTILKNLSDTPHAFSDFFLSSPVSRPMSPLMSLFLVCRPLSSVSRLCSLSSILYTLSHMICPLSHLHLSLSPNPYQMSQFPLFCGSIPLFISFVTLFPVLCSRSLVLCLMSFVLARMFWVVLSKINVHTNSRRFRCMAMAELGEWLVVCSKNTSKNLMKRIKIFRE